MFGIVTGMEPIHAALGVRLEVLAAFLSWAYFTSSPFLTTNDLPIGCIGHAQKEWDRRKELGRPLDEQRSPQLSQICSDAV